METYLIVLIVAVLAVAGYLVWHQSRPSLGNPWYPRRDSLYAVEKKITAAVDKLGSPLTSMAWTNVTQSGPPTKQKFLAFLQNWWSSLGPNATATPAGNAIVQLEAEVRNAKQ